MAFVLVPGHAFLAPPGAKAPAVIVAVVQQKAFVDEIEALGTLRANESVDLTASVTELVTAVNFEDGERVTKEKILVEMDSAEEQALLGEEKSTLEEAERQLKRTGRLAAQGVSTESLFDERTREVKTAKARIQAIQSRIDQRHIKAPFDGVVGLRNISVGSLIQPGTLVTTIDDDSVMKLDFSVPALFLSTLKPSVHIEAYTNAYPDEMFTGTISSVNSRVDPITRAIVARALIENPKRKLKPGLLMRVTLQKNPRQALVVPEQAIVTNADTHAVFVVEQEEAQTIATKREVTIGARRKGEVEILSGVAENDLVIVHGLLKAKPGKPVTIMATQEGEVPLSSLIRGQ